MACAVCGLVLNRRVLASADGLTEEWLHNQPADHPTVPVPVSDIRTNFRCDFCLADNARWTLPVAQYEAAPGNMNEGDWAACDVCADLVRAGKWNAIVGRVAKAFRAQSGQSVQTEALRMVYRQLRANITGPLRLTVRPDRAGSTD